MKHIKKRRTAPREYRKWCKDHKGKENEDYRCLQNPEKDILHKALLEEQGFLCAYTLKKIEKDSSHIEHIKPETLCRKELRGSDLIYENLVACFPKEGMKATCRYGAQVKDKWWEDEGRQFVSPLYGKCEALLVFNTKGEISAFQNDPDAKVTIDVLKLDNKILTEDRKRAIFEYINGQKGDDPLRKKDTEKAINIILKSNSKGEFVEFCVAIKHSLIEHITYLEKISAKMKYSKQQKQKG